MTAFLKNCWYCAGWSSELTTKPIGRVFLNEEVVLFRDSKGEAKALPGTCPHRFAPLAQGKIVGDSVECPYHGLQFSGSGQCVFNPHGSGMIPPNAHLKSYPLVEKHGALWIWPGDPKLADTGKIPAFDFVSDRENWAAATGHLRMDASYELVVDNLMDLTHANYIHQNTLSAVSSDSDIKMEADFDFSDDVISSLYTIRNAPPTPVFKAFTDMPKGDMYAQISLHPASSFLMSFALTGCDGDRDEALEVPSAHLLVPETETSCHYFYAVARNDKLDNSEITRKMVDIVVSAFADEDAPMIKACQNGMRGQEFWSMRPVVLETDVAAVRARRVLKKLLLQEQEGVASNDIAISDTE